MNEVLAIYNRGIKLTFTDIKAIRESVIEQLELGNYNQVTINVVTKYERGVCIAWI